MVVGGGWGATVSLIFAQMLDEIDFRHFFIGLVVERICVFCVLDVLTARSVVLGSN